MREKMRIGIDIDGVITNLERFQLDYGSKYFLEKYGKDIANPNGYEILEIFDLNKKQYDAFWKDNLEMYATKENPRPFANEIINKLKEEGNEIYLITARLLTQRDDEVGEKMRDSVKNWLKENNIYYDKIIFSPEDKLEVCLENQIDLMIEDREANINNISTKIPVICFDARYNQKCEGKNIIRCYSWYDVYTKIKTLNSNKS